MFVSLFLRQDLVLSQASLELEVLLPQPLECWEYEHEAPCLRLILWYSMETIIIVDVLK